MTVQFDVRIKTLATVKGWAEVLKEGRTFWKIPRHKTYFKLLASRGTDENHEDL